MKSITSKDIKLLPLKKGGHKGENGRVLIIGGSRDFVGAPFLAGISALRFVDYVSIACPVNVGWIINSLSPDLITKKFDCDYLSKNFLKDILDYSKTFDAVLIGSGLSAYKKTLEFVEGIVKDIRKPMVIDADALKARLDVKNAVLTPHKKEYEQLSKEAIKNNIVIKKGPVDEILIGKTTDLNKGGVDRMAVAGTGDVLAGIIVGLLGRGMTPRDAAKAGVFISSKIGELAKKELGSSFFASEMTYYISIVLKALE